ncbi:MAG: sigma 54-interacting transcriptional regulator [Planctomycetota bacterium]
MGELYTPGVGGTHGLEEAHPLLPFLRQAQGGIGSGVRLWYTLDPGLSWTSMPRKAPKAESEEILFGRYKVVRLLGRGGVGSVYLVEDKAEGDQKALKIVDLPPGGRDAFDLIRSEFEVLGKYRHPHLARAYEIGREGDRAYFSLEYVSGTTLLDATGTLDLSGILRLALQVLRALGFVHSLGLVHGDMKPQNVLVDMAGPQPSARLLDFGLAESILEAGGSITGSSGTPAYIAPEKTMGAPPDLRSDLYSFGVTLFQILTGQLPFRGKDPADLIEQHRFQAPPDPTEVDATLPAALGRICARLMAKEPSQRYPSAMAVLAALIPLVPGVPSQETAQEGRHLIMAAFVGREISLAELERTIHPSLEGSTPPKAVVVQGPGGIGKTRLIGEIALNARVRGCRVIEAACEADHPFCLEPLRRMLQPLLGEADALNPPSRTSLRSVEEGTFRLGTGPEFEERILHLLNGLHALFSAGSRTTPLLFLLEDVHDADPGCLKILMRFLGENPEGAWAMIGSARDRSAHPETGRLLHAGKEKGTIEALALEPLTGSEVGRWVTEALPGITFPEAEGERIAAWGKGHPLLIREALLAGVEEGRFVPGESGWRYVPPGPGETFPTSGVETGRRFQALPPEQREIMGALALHSAPVSLKILARYMGKSEPAALFPVLRELRRGGWVREPEKGKSFTVVHDRMRRAIGREMERKDREGGHRRFGEILSLCAEEDGSWVPSVAEHWARAGHTEETARWGYRAGQMLEGQGALRVARRYYRAAKRASVLAGWDPTKQSEIDIGLGNSYLFLMNPKRAEPIFRDVTRRSLPLSLLATAYYRLGYTLFLQAKTEDALRAYEESRRLLEKEGDENGVARMTMTITGLLNESGRYQEAVELAEKLKAQFPEDREKQAWIAYSLGRSLGPLGRLEEAFHHLKNALRSGRKIGNPTLPHWTAYLLGYIRLSQGQSLKAFRWYGAAQRGFARLEYGYGKSLTQGVLGSLLLQMGRAGEAYENVSEALGAFQRMEEPRGTSMMLKFLIEMGLGAGRYRFVLERIHQLEERLSRGGNLSMEMRGSEGRYWISFLLQAGSLDLAKARVVDVQKTSTRIDPFFRSVSRIMEARVLLESGFPREALEVISREESESIRNPLSHIWLDMQKARIQGSLGKEKEAEEGFRKSREDLLRLDYVGSIPEVGILEARWALSAGKLDRSFERALEVVEKGDPTGRTSLIWEGYEVAGEALERMGKPRRAAKFFRRAVWAMEREAAAFPEPYRSSFLSKKEVLPLQSRIGKLRAEDTAARLARVLGIQASRSAEDWTKTALHWANVVARALGADAMVFQALWPDALPAKVAFRRQKPTDEAWTIPFGSRGPRPGSATLFRRWERGSFLPVARRIALILIDHLSLALERSAMQAMTRRFERRERTLQAKCEETETALATARLTLSQTQSALGRAQGYGEMIGTSKAMKRVYGLIRRWGPTDATLLVTGESGTGKELVARAVHNASKRKDGSFFAVNCAALAESILESELFGYEKGAFTGADETHPGLFEHAFGGTLILDEVADMSPKMQGQLLRVLEDRKIRRVGGSKSFPVNVRVIALSNRPLETEAKAKRFREDLFHRLNMASISLPPLRERKEDIPLLAEYFLAETRKGMTAHAIPRNVLALLMRHAWPGNVRELKNRIHRADVLSGDRDLLPEDFPELKKKAVTKTSLSEKVVAKVRKAAAEDGFPVERRHMDLFRVLAAGGAIRRREFEQMAGISTRTARRDFERFVRLGLIRRVGKGKGTMYELA